MLAVLIKFGRSNKIVHLRKVCLYLATAVDSIAKPIRVQASMTISFEFDIADIRIRFRKLNDQIGTPRSKDRK